MDAKQPHDDNRHAGLGSTEYRTKLLTKLNCLMAVLEVAITKLNRSMELPSANQERLGKIRANLENTLAICTRAKETLERTAMNESKPQITTSGSAKQPKQQPQQQAKGSMSYRDYVELSSIEEYQKFKKLPPINAEDLDGADIDDLLGKLFDA